MTSIENGAFHNCSSLTNVYYCGTEAEWEEIAIDDSNSELISATRYYYSEEEPALNDDQTAYDGNYWHYDEEENPVVWKKE